MFKRNETGKMLDPLKVTSSTPDTKPWLTILLLIFFFPAGLYRMWKYKQFSLMARKIITVIIFILGIYGYITDVYQTPEEKATILQQEKITLKQKEVEDQKKTEEELAKINLLNKIKDSYGKQQATEFLMDNTFSIVGNGMGRIKLLYSEYLDTTAIIDWSRDWVLVTTTPGQPSELTVDDLMRMVDDVDRHDLIIKTSRYVERKAMEMGSLSASVAFLPGTLTRRGYRSYKYTQTIKLKNAFGAKYKRDFSVNISTDDTSYYFSDLEFYISN